ncbi:MAG TPA: DUF177 domain-containing protein [Aggregatilineales bacterium]|nr:DUF177 domain-containing protein [Aggregatilineales bacterium]
MNKRVLKINVGFLLNAPSSTINDSTLDFPDVQISDEITLNYIRGDLRMSRTKEGILVQSQVETAFNDECFRCLDPIQHVSHFQLEELYAFNTPTETEFRIDEDGVLDFGALLRAETLIEKSHRALCKPDCKGLCPECGTNWNHATCTCADDAIDPRFAILKTLLEK